MAVASAPLNDLLREQLGAAQRVIELNRAIFASLNGQDLNSGNHLAVPGSSAISTASRQLTPTDDDLKNPLTHQLGQLASAVQRFELQDYTYRQRHPTPLLPDHVDAHEGHVQRLRVPLLHSPSQFQSPSRLLALPGVAQGSKSPVSASTSPRHFNGNKVAEKTRFKRQRSIFPNAEEIKQQLKESLFEPEYNVENFYHETGCAQAVARSETFKNIAFIAIFLNAGWIAFDVDTNKADVLSQAPVLNQVVENVFTVFFCFEIVVRFAAFNEKLKAFKDGWFVFDFLMVLLMIWGTWLNVLLYWWLSGQGEYSNLANYSSLFRIFRLARLTRIARLARLLRDVPELMILVKGMFLAMRSVFSTLCMLFLIIYSFALFFTQLLWDSPAGKGCFENVPQAMNCLLLDGVFSDQADFIRQLLDAGLLYYGLILTYLVLGSLTILNMLIGILCEVVSVAAQIEKEEGMVQSVKEKLKDVMPDIDTNANAHVSKEEFKVLISSPQALKELSHLDIDVVAMVDLADAIFYEAEEMGFDDFVKTLLQLRGSNTATVKDVVDVRKFISLELMKLEERLTFAIAEEEREP